MINTINFKGNIEFQKKPLKQKNVQKEHNPQTSFKGISFNQAQALRASAIAGISFRGNSALKEEKHNFIVNDLFKDNVDGIKIPAEKKLKSELSISKSPKAGFQDISIKNAEGKTILKAEKANDFDAKLKFFAGKSGLSAHIALPNGLNALMTQNSEFNVGNKLKIEMPSEKDVSFTGHLYSSNAVSTQGELVEQAVDSYFSAERTEEKKSDIKLKEDYNIFVPAAGEGSRLGNLSKAIGDISLPKPVVPTPGEGKPLVHNVLSNLDSNGLLKDVNKAEHLREDVPGGNLSGLFQGLLNGSISTKKPMLVCPADIITDINLKEFLHEYEEKDSAITILGKHISSNDLNKHGVVKVNDNNEVQAFLEKPGKGNSKAKFAEIAPDTYLAASGTYVLAPESLSWMKDNLEKDKDIFKDSKGLSDFYQAVFQKLLNECKEGKIKDQDGKALRMNIRFVKHKASDLGMFPSYLKAARDVAAEKFDLPKAVIDNYKKAVDVESGIVFLPGGKEKYQEFCQ